MNAQNDTMIDGYVNSLDTQTAADSRTLISMMRKISGHEPRKWNVGTIGFGTYHYKYGSGREGDGHVIGFYPRKGRITIYLMDGTARYEGLLAELGRYAKTGYCVHIRHLSDIRLPVLERIVRKSFDHITSLSKKGPIESILWRSDT